MDDKPISRRGGRKAGVPNKRTQKLIDRLESLDCDPLEGLAKIAKQAESEGELSLAADCYNKLMPYVYHKRKAVEVEHTHTHEHQVINYVPDQSKDITPKLYTIEKG